MKIMTGLLAALLAPFCAMAYYDVGDWRVDYIEKSKTAILKSYRGSSSSITIPDIITIEVFDHTQGDYNEVVCDVELGDALFSGNTSIVSIYLNGHTHIPSFCFYKCSSLQTVSGSFGLREVGDSAFYGCGALVSIPSLKSIRSIGGEAFRGCGKLTIDVDLPYVTTIGDSAFNGCSSLYGAVNLPNATTIEDEAFCGCTSLTSVSIKSVSALGNCIFSGCTSISDALISGNSDIKGGVFRGCTNLRKVELSGDTTFKDFTVVSGIAGVVINIISPFEGCTNLREVTLGENFTWIPQKTFKDLYSLEHVTITSWLTNIHDSAFAYCTKLKSVEGADSVKNINDSAFINCSSLELFDGFSSATNIGEQAFAGCVSLTSSVVADGLSVLGDRAFVGCTSLATVVVHNLSSIGNSAFSGCSGLETAILSGNTTVASSLFSDCKSLRRVEILGEMSFSVEGYHYESYRPFYGAEALEEVVLGEGVNFIPSSVFSGKALLTNVCVSSSLETIDSSAFSGCSSLSKIEGMKSLKQVGAYAFHDCSSLRTFEGFSSVTNIGRNAFNNCTSLAAVVAHNLSSIGNSAFSGCSGLETAILSGNTTIASSLFSDCKSLRRVEILGEMSFPVEGYHYESYRPFYGAEALEEVVLGEGVNFIPSSVFSGKALLTNVCVSSSLETIGSSAFSGCSSLPKIEGIKSLKEVGAYAFQNCSSLRTFEGFSSVTNIGRNAFDGCLKLSDSLELPTVKHIEEYAFNNCTSLTSVVACDLSVLGGYVFSGCTGLESVSLSGSAIIANSLFSGCKSLRRVEILGETCFPTNGYNHMRSMPFYDTGSLEEVVLGEGVDFIPFSVFSDQTLLTNVCVSSSLETIGSSAFSGCSSLPKIEGMKSLKQVGAYAFRNCSSLESFEGFLTVTNLGREAFSGCCSLTGKVELARVQKVEDYAFKGCEKLKHVKFGKDLEVVRADAFSGSTNLIAFTFEGLPPEADNNAFRNVKMGALGIYPGSTLQLDDSENLLRSAQPLSETSDVKEWNDVIAEDGTWQELLMQVNKPVLTNDLYNVKKGSLRLNWKSEKTPEVDKLKKHCITFEIRRGFSDDYKSAEVLTNGYDQLTYTDTQFDSTGDVSRISSIWYWVKPEHPEVKEEDKVLQHSNACRTRNRYMINVGINNYKDNSQTQLINCVSDAQGWANKLNYTSYINEPYLSDQLATKENICKRLKDLSNKVTPGDLVVYTHSSHGNQNLLCCYGENHLTAAEFGNELRRFSKYTRIVVIIDACKSGSIPSGMDARAMRMQSTSRAEERTFVDSVIEYMDSPRMGMLSSGTGDSTTISSSSEIGWLTAVSANELSIDGVYSGECLQSAGWENSGADHDDDGWITFEDLGVFATYWMGRMYDQYEMTPQMKNPDRLRVLAGEVIKPKKYKKILNAPSITLNENADPYTISITLIHDPLATGYRVRAYNASTNIFIPPFRVLSGSGRFSLTLNAGNHIPVSNEPFNIYVKAINPMDVSEHSNVVNDRMRESESINEVIRRVNESRPNGTPSIVNDDGSNNYESLNQDHDGDGRTTFQEVYVGSDPFDATSQFTANITMENGKPKVTPVPDLGDARKYTIYGKTDLGNPAANWTDMSSVPEEEKPEYRFFKVGVSLP